MAIVLTHIYRILDHCGCALRGTFEKAQPVNLIYFSACDRCSEHISRDGFQNYILAGGYDLQMYSLKELLGVKGWISESAWRSLMIRRQYPVADYLMNATAITMRLMNNERPARKLSS